MALWALKAAMKFDRKGRWVGMFASVSFMCVRVLCPRRSRIGGLKRQELDPERSGFLLVILRGEVQLRDEASSCPPPALLL
jgi:hypothetical protein